MWIERPRCECHECTQARRPSINEQFHNSMQQAVQGQVLILSDGLSYDVVMHWITNRGGEKITSEFLNSLTKERMNEFLKFSGQDVNA